MTYFWAYGALQNSSLPFKLLPTLSTCHVFYFHSIPSSTNNMRCIIGRWKGKRCLYSASLSHYFEEPPFYCSVCCRFLGYVFYQFCHLQSDTFLGKVLQVQSDWMVSFSANQINDLAHLMRLLHSASLINALLVLYGSLGGWLCLSRFGVMPYNICRWLTEQCSVRFWKLWFFLITS